jgi:hypothetical protein
MNAAQTAFRSGSGRSSGSLKTAQKARFQQVVVSCVDEVRRIGIVRPDHAAKRGGDRLAAGDRGIGSSPTEHEKVLALGVELMQYADPDEQGPF